MGIYIGKERNGIEAGLARIESGIPTIRDDYARFLNLLQVHPLSPTNVLDPSAPNDRYGYIRIGRDMFAAVLTLRYEIDDKAHGGDIEITPHTLCTGREWSEMSDEARRLLWFPP